MRTSREVWAKRVQRWQDSDLTAAEFAAEIGVNPKTLSYWKWKLRRDGGQPQERSKSASATSKRSTPRKSQRRVKFVEVTPAAVTGQRIELVVDAGVVIRVPDGFEAETLRRVLQTVGKKDQT